jgi:hypothetical protein
MPNARPTEEIPMNKTRQKRAGAPALLATAFTLLLVSLWTPAEVRAQWTTPDAGGNINNTNPGNVRVGGGTAAPTAVVHTRGNLSSALAGTVTVTQNSAAVTGTGTAFDTELSVGDSIKIGTEVFTVSAIASATSLTLDSNYLGSSGSGLNAYRDPNLFAVDNGDSVSKLVVTKSGKVGIGNAAPGNTMLDIVNTSSGVYSPSAGPVDTVRIRTLNNSVTNNSFSSLKFQVTANNGVHNALGFLTLVQPSFSSHNSEFAFTLRKGDGSYAEAMRIQSGGNIGIGTPSPSFKLDVAGQVRSSSGGFVFPDGTTQTTASSGTVTGVTAGNGLTDGGSAGSLTLNVGAGTGLSVAADSISVNYGSTAGTAVQGNTSVSISAGAGMSGGGTLTLGAGGTLTLTNNDKGSSQSIFKNVANAAGVAQFSAGSNSDSISFEGTGGTSVSFNPAAKKVTISSAAPATTFAAADISAGQFGANTGGGNYSFPGDVTVAGNIGAKYQDVAEWVPSVQKLAPGTVVVLDSSRTNHVLASASAYDTKVAGVVSAEPGVILGVAGEGKVKVATTGRVKVKADASRGAIKVGDLLVTSDVEGVAMKSVPVDLGGTQIHRPGTIIGKALESLDKGTGEILVLLSLQ